MKRVKIGIVGAGFIAETRAHCYRRCFGYRAEIVAVAARTSAHAAAFAARWSIPAIHDDYRALLDSRDVHVVDVCAPNHLHSAIAIAAAQSGKHIICTKPLTGYFGEPGDRQPIGHVSKRKMLERAVQDAEAILGAARRHGVQLMYAENWVYAPAVQKARRLIEASGGVGGRGGEPYESVPRALTLVQGTGYAPCGARGSWWLSLRGRRARVALRRPQMLGLRSLRSLVRTCWRFLRRMPRPLSAVAARRHCAGWSAVS